MKKRTILFLALGLAATLQAQNAAPEQAASPAPQANQTAVTEQKSTSDSAAVAQVAPDSAKATTVAVDSSVTAASAAIADSATVASAPADSAKKEALPVTDTVLVAQAPADSAVKPVADTTTAAVQAPADSAKASTDSALVKQEPKADSSVAQVPADSAKAPVDSALAKQEKAKVAKALANKLGEIVHGNAYNTVGNEAAAATIGSNLNSPHRMHGSKLVYFDPIAEQGVLAFGNSLTYFLSFSNENNLGLLSAGMAFGKFGFAIDYAMAKAWRYTDHADGTSETEKNTAAGSIVGAKASMNFGSFDLAIAGHYQTPYGNALLSLPHSEQEYDAWAADGYLGLSYSGDLIYWTLGVGAVRNDAKFKSSVSEIKVIDGQTYLATTKTTISDTLSNIEILPEFSIGATALSSENANVYLGVNAAGAVVVFDEITGINDRHHEAVLLLTPNILGEVMLSKYFMAFGGASYNWVAAQYSDRELNNEANKTILTATNSTTVSLGARFEYGPAAIELAFEKTFLQNPFGAFSSTDGIVTSLGAFINF